MHHSCATMRDPSQFNIYCQEPKSSPHEDGLRIAVIADGNGRRGQEGYTLGARSVIRCAEHCRERRDIALFCALLLSPENVRKRGQRFFAKLHALFVRLAADVTRGRALAGIRCELYGGLGALKRRGGAAKELAHAIELLIEVGSRVEAGPRFVIGVDYDDAVISALHLDLVVRTGMESPGSIRLSGLTPHPSAACVATTKLWCDFEPCDLDEAISAAERRPHVAFASGYDERFAAAFVEELLRADIRAPLHLVLPVAAPEQTLVAALARLETGPLGAQDRLSVVFTPRRGRRARRFGPRGRTVQSLLLFSPSRRPRAAPKGPYAALLAPGQPSSVWDLADVPLGYATGHGCAPTPRGLVDGVLHALQVHAEHPPLLGGERARPEEPADPGIASFPPRIEELIHLVSHHPCSSAEEIAQAIAGRDERADRQLVADVFVAKELGWARSRGLLSAAAHWQQAALNYAYTGLAIPFRLSEPFGPRGPAWEALASHLTRFMLIVAASDEEITDRVFPGETVEERSSRRDASARFLTDVIVGEAPCPPPSVRGAEILAAIAAYLGETRARFATASQPRLFDGFCRALAALYAANLSERSAAVTDNAWVRRLGSTRAFPGAAAAVERRYALGAPGCVGDRLRAYLAAACGDHRAAADARRAIRLLCYLIDVAPSIGASATFRAASLCTPADTVSDAMVIAFDHVAALVDYRFRMANDLSDLASAAARDRDDKENAWTILLPKGSTGRARAQALVDAVIACDAVMSWLDDELRRAMVELDLVWPDMAAMIRRGVRVGGRVYALGHYATVSRRDIGAVLDEIASDERAGSVAVPVAEAA